MYEKEKLVHCFYNQRTIVKLKKALCLCIKLISPFNSLDATNDNRLKSLSVFLTLFGNMINSCHFEKSTLNKAGNHEVLLIGFTEFHVGIRTKNFISTNTFSIMMQ